MYDLTCLTNATDWGVMAGCANTATEGTLFGGISIALFFVLLIGLRRGGGWNMDDALLVSSFALFILTGILSYGGFVNIIFPLGFLALLAFTGLYVWASRNY